MKQNETKPTNLHSTSIVWSICTMFISTLILFSIGEGAGNGTAGYVIADLLIALACFYIVKQNPASIWYAPVLSNGLGIIAAFAEPNFWITSLWILNAIGWGLSIGASVVGAVKGKRVVVQKV